MPPPPKYTMRFQAKAYAGKVDRLVRWIGMAAMQANNRPEWPQRDVDTPKHLIKKEAKRVVPNKLPVERSPLLGGHILAPKGDGWQ